MFGLKLPQWPTRTERCYVDDDCYGEEYTVEVKLTVKEIVIGAIRKKGRAIASWLHLQGEHGCCGPQGPKGDRGEKGELDADSLIALLHNDPNVKQAVLALMDQRNS